MKSLELFLHRIALNISSHDDKIVDWMRNSYYSCAAPDIQKTYDLRFEQLGSPYQMKLVPPQDGQLVGIATLYSPCLYKDGLLFSSGESSNPHELYFDLRSGELNVNLGALLMADEETFIYAVVRDLFKKIIFPFGGFVALHAAVVNKAGKTFCLLGDKGAGKSTLALQLMETGYSMLSDDSPMFSLDNNKVFAWSSLDNLSMTENTLALFPHLKPLASGKRDISGKHYIPRVSLSSSVLCNEPAVATHLIDLQRKDVARPTLKAYDKFAMLQALMEESMVLFRSPESGRTPPEFQQANRVMLDTIAQLVDQSQVYILEYADRHLSELPQLLESI